MCVYPFDMKLILQGDRQTVQRPDWLLVLGIILVEFFGRGDGGIKEDLVKAVNLSLVSWHQ